MTPALAVAIGWQSVLSSVLASALGKTLASL